MTEQEAREIIELLEQHETLSQAAKATGVPRGTLQSRLERAKQIITTYVQKEELSIPVLSDGEMPAEELIDKLTQNFERRREASQKKKWMPIYAKTDLPIGLAFLGDPHLDDDGCDWPTLRRHVEIIQNTEGLHGCSVGDQHNNWVGRLSRLYAEQETSAAQAWKLVEWFIQAIDPLLLIAGNHDMWSGSGDPVKWMQKPRTIYEDWAVRVSINFKNGKSCRIFAAHDMAGHSMWNQLHGQLKAAKFGQNADLYISGHKHNWALAQIELPESGRVPWLARARGYKFMDDYAKVKGYDEQNYGHAIGCIIDPQAKNPTSFMTCFADLEEAADYLTWKRGRAK